MELKMILVFLEVRAIGRSHLFLKLRNLGKKVLLIQGCLPKMILLLSCIQAAVQVYQRFVPAFSSLYCSFVPCCLWQQEDGSRIMLSKYFPIAITGSKWTGRLFFLWVADAQFECGPENRVLCLYIIMCLDIKGIKILFTSSTPEPRDFLSAKILINTWPIMFVTFFVCVCWKLSILLQSYIFNV